MENVRRFSIFLTLLITAITACPSFGRDIIVNRSDDDVVDPPSSADMFVDPPSVVYDENLLSHYSPELKAFIDSCSNRMTTECGKEVFEVMFQDREVTRECCINLLQMGRSCHLALVDTVLRTYEYKDEAYLAFPRSRMSWNICARDYGNEIGSPIPLEHFSDTYTL